MKIEAPQMAQMARGLFFARVAAVVRDRTPHDGLRAATLDTPLRDALWTPHWDWIAGQPEGSAALFMADLLKQAGVPDGAFNVVHGDKAAVDALLDEPRVQALSFVFPNFQLFNLADNIGQGAGVDGQVALRVAGYGVAYIAVIGGLAVYSFRSREI